MTMNNDESAIHIKNIDLTIVDILDRLNKLGYKTIVSCCGFDYTNQGIKNHTNAHIGFRCDFNQLKKLYDAVREAGEYSPSDWGIDGPKPFHIYWSFCYGGEDNWEISHESPDMFDEERRPYYEASLINNGWPMIRKALDKLEGK